MKKYLGLGVSIVLTILLVGCGTTGGGVDHGSGVEHLTLKDPVLEPKTKIDLEKLSGDARYVGANPLTVQLKDGLTVDLDSRLVMHVNFDVNRINASISGDFRNVVSGDKVHMVGIDSMNLLDQKIKTMEDGSIGFEGDIGSYTDDRGVVMDSALMDYTMNASEAKELDMILAKDATEWTDEEQAKADKHWLGAMASSVKLSGKYKGHFSGDQAEKVDVSIHAQGGGMSVNGEIVGSQRK